MLSSAAVTTLFGYITSPKQEIYSGEERSLTSRVDQSPIIAVGCMQICIVVDYQIGSSLDFLIAYPNEVMYFVERTYRLVSFRRTTVTIEKTRFSRANPRSDGAHEVSISSAIGQQQVASYQITYCNAT